jgi:lysophospholipase L1-like esterase
MTLAKNLLLAVLSLTTCFGFLEGVSRWIRPVALPQPVHATAPMPLVPDYLLFFRMPPNSPITNSLGLRGPEVGKKPEDEFRILSLGESSTFGWRLQEHQTYSFVLERRLGRTDGRRVRVVNAGVPAYTSFQGLIYLRYRGMDLAPDAVLVYFGANDFTPITFRTTRSAPKRDNVGMTDRELFERRRNPLVRIASLLLAYSNLFRVAALNSDAPTVAQPRSRVPPADRRWVLRELREVCRAHGVRLVVVIPWYREFKLHIPLLREFAATTDVPVVDLPEKLSELPGPREDYFMDDFHPNARGQRAIAEAIREELSVQWDRLGRAARP